jgi:hypothetical protein
MAINAAPPRHEFYDERIKAVSFIESAFNEAEEEGVTPHALAQAALFAALAEMVCLYGEEETANFADKLKNRVLNGEFSCEMTLQ